jgi:hypothetical protein
MYHVLCRRERERRETTSHLISCNILSCTKMFLTHILQILSKSSQNWPHRYKKASPKRTQKKYRKKKQPTIVFLDDFGPPPWGLPQRSGDLLFFASGALAAPPGSQDVHLGSWAVPGPEKYYILWMCRAVSIFSLFLTNVSFWALLRCSVLRRSDDRDVWFLMNVLGILYF